MCKKNCHHDIFWVVSIKGRVDKVAKGVEYERYSTPKTDINVISDGANHPF